MSFLDQIIAAALAFVAIIGALFAKSRLDQRIGADKEREKQSEADHEAVNQANGARDNVKRNPDDYQRVRDRFTRR